MKNQFRMNIKLDFWSIGLALVLSIIGILFIYSSSSNLADNSKYLKQMINLFISLMAYMFVMNINYQRYTTKSILVYGAGILFLLLTLALGTSINNSRSWINLGFFNIQLSEFSKVTFLVAFAVFLNNYQNNIKRFSFLMVSFVLLLPYLMLIVLQPDIGTAVIFVIIFFSMFFMGGGNGSYLGITMGIGFLAVIIPFFTYYLIHVAEITGTFIEIMDSSFYLTLMGFMGLALAGIAYFFYRYARLSKKFIVASMVLLTIGFGLLGTNGVKLLFKDYHYKRFLVFLDPELDPTGKGYNIQQSKISIGSGGFMGQGFTKGKQNRGNFLPAEDTDFIISLVAEEWGFLGIIIVLGLYLFLIYRCLYIAYSARDFVGSMIAAGITSMYIGHIMLNIFSAMGFFPVIGVPLPFLSYGGSSLLTSYLGLGILFNIKMRRFSYN